MAKKFWEQPWYLEYLEDLKRKQTNKKDTNELLKTTINSTVKNPNVQMVPRRVANISPARTYIQAKQAEIERMVGPTKVLPRPSSVTAMPDRVVEKLPPVSPYTYLPQAAPPPNRPDLETVQPAGARRVKPAPPPKPKQTFKATPDTKVGQEVYLSYDKNARLTFITARPTDIKLFNYNGTMVPVSKNDSGKWALDKEITQLGVTLDNMIPMVYTPDLLETLNSTKTAADLLKPLTLDGMIKLGEALYYDPIVNQITARPTQTQIFWTPDHKELTYERTATDDKGMVVTNDPVEFDVQSSKFLQETLTKEHVEFDAFTNLDVAGNPTRASDIRFGLGTVRTEDLQAMHGLDYTLNKQTGETVNLLDEQGNVYPFYLTPETPIANFPIQMKNFETALRNSKLFQTLVVPVWAKFDPVKAAPYVDGAIAAISGFYALFDQTSIVPKQSTLFSSESQTVRRSGLGNTVPAFLSNLLTQFLGRPLVSATRFLAFPISLFEKATASGMWKFAQSIQDQLEMAVKDKRAVADDQLQRAMYLELERPGISLSPTQLLQDTYEYTEKFDVGDRGVSTQLEMAGLGSNDALVTYVNRMNSNVAAGQSLMDGAIRKQYSGLTGEAVDEFAEGMYRYYVWGLDWAAINNWIDGRYEQKPIQAGVDKILAGDVPVTSDEFHFLWQFMAYNTVTPTADVRSFMPKFNIQPDTGANYLFFRHAADVSLAKGRPLTLDELYEESITWLAGYYQNPISTKEFRELMLQRSQARHDRALTLNRTAKSYRVLGEGAPDEATQQYYFGLADEMIKAAQDLLVATYPMDRKAGNIDPFSAYTWDAKPERLQQVYQNVALAELQLGRPPTRQEITDIASMSVDIVIEMVGEMAFDAMELLGVFKVGKIAINAAQKGITKTLVKSAKGISVLNALAAVQDEISNMALIRHMKGRALASQAFKQSEVMAELTSDILRSNPQTKEEFVALFERVANDIVRIKSAGTKTEAAEIIASIMPNRPTILSAHTLQEAADLLTETIDPKRWPTIAGEVWDENWSHMIERAAHDYNKVWKLDPSDASLQTLRTNNITAKATQNFFSWAGQSRMATELGSQFRKTFSDANRAWTNSVIFSDTWWAKLGFTGKESTAGIYKWRQILEGVYKLNQTFMNAWVWATLARRPAWMLYNFIDNTFRFFVGGAGDIRDIFFLMQTGVGQKIASNVKIPAHVASDLSALTFRYVVEPLGEGISQKKYLPSILNLRDNPLGFLQHYRVNYLAMTDGKNALTKAYTVFSAFPVSVKSLANAIEYGTRIRMWYKLYTNNVNVLNKTILTNLLDGAEAIGESPRVLGLKERLLATGMSELDANKWVQHVKDMWLTSGSNSQRFERSLQLLATPGEYLNERLFLPEIITKAAWFDETLQRPLITAVLDELQKFVTTQADAGLTKLTKVQVDQFFDRVIAMFDAESNAKLSTIWNQQAQILRNFDIDSGRQELKGTPYYPEATTKSKDFPLVTDSGNDAVKAIPRDATKLTNTQRRLAKKAVKENRVVIPNDADENLVKAVNTIRERSDAIGTKPQPLTDEQIRAVENDLKDILPADVPTNAIEMEVLDRVIQKNIPRGIYLEAGKRRAIAAKNFGDVFGQPEFTQSRVYSRLERPDRDLIAAHGRNLDDAIRHVASSINSFWIEVWPGPRQLDAAGNIIFTARTSKSWEQAFNLIARQWNSQVFMYEELLDDVRRGNFTLLSSYSVKDMLDKAGIQPMFDAKGRVVRIRMHNPVTNEWKTTDSVVAVSQFKKITGVENQRIYTGSIQELGKGVIPDSKKAFTIEAKILPTPFPSYDEMVNSTPRLALAIKEGRLADANRILAGEFRYHMFYEKAGQLVPADSMLLNRIWKEIGGDSKKQWKTLQDVPPDITHKVLDDWAQTHHGYQLGKMVKGLQDDLTVVFQKQYSWTEAGARDYFKLWDRVMENVSRLLSDTLGRPITKDETWAHVYFGFYKIDPTVDGKAMRGLDGRQVFQSNLNDFIERSMTNNMTGAEILERMKSLGFSEGELKWNGMYQWLVKNKDEAITQSSLKKLVFERERYLEAQTQAGGVWSVTLKDGKGNQLVQATGALSLDPDTNLFRFNLTKVEGDVDEYSLQRLQRWARDEEATHLVMPDGVVHDLRKVPPSLKATRRSDFSFLGSTDFVKNELDRHSAIIKAFAGSNPTTSLHEMFHAVEDYLPDAAKKVLDDYASETLLRMQVSNDPAYKLYKDLDPAVARSEITARAWEKYVITEMAPNSEVGHIFKAIKNYLVNFYRSMGDYFGGVYLTPEVRKVFDQMVGDGWKQAQADKLPKPRSPGPKPKVPAKPITSEDALKAARKAKETVTSKPVIKKKDPATKVADLVAVDDIDRAQGRWLQKGTFYPVPRKRRFLKGYTAQDVIDHEIKELRGDLKINPDIDMSSVSAQHTIWVAFDEGVAVKHYKFSDPALKNLTSTQYPYFRVLAVDGNGHALIEYSAKAPKGAEPLMQEIHAHQSILELMNGPENELKTAMRELLDIYTQDDVARLVSQFEPIVTKIEDKLIASNYTMLAKDLTPAEREALSFLANNFLPPSIASTYPQKPVQRFAQQVLDANGNYISFGVVGNIDIDDIIYVNDFATFFDRVANAVWEPISKGELPKVQRISEDVLSILEQRGFDPVVLAGNISSDYIHNALISGRKLTPIPVPDRSSFMDFAARSKVKTPDGRPLPVYHASRFNFVEFNAANDMGHHFGTVYAALDRAHWQPSWQLHAYWLNIENPIKLTDNGGWGYLGVANQLAEIDLISATEALALKNEAAMADNIMEGLIQTLDETTPITMVQADKLMNELYTSMPILKDYGNFDAKDLMVSWNLNAGLYANSKTVYSPLNIHRRVGSSRVVAGMKKSYAIDGIEYVNAFENRGSTSYMAFYKNQIKRVDNVGTYNPKVDHVRFQMLSDLIDDSAEHVENSQRALKTWTKSVSGMLDNVDSLFLDARTGFMNANVLVSYPDALSKPNTAYLIGNGFDYIVREMGDDAADHYLRNLASALRGAGLDEADIFHMGDARFVIQMDDARKLDDVLEAVANAPTVRVYDDVGELWDIDLDISHSGVGSKNDIPEQFQLAQEASEKLRSDSYVDWLRHSGEERTEFRNEWEALDDADLNGAEIATHKYIRPADPIFQEVPYQQWYYHKAEREIEKMDFKSTSTARLRSVLPKFVSADEMKWSGLDDFLSENKNVTKQEVLDFLRENQIEVNKVTPEMRRSAMSGDQSLFQKTDAEDLVAKAKQPDIQPEIDEAWRAFAQSPIFTHGSQQVSLADLWGVLFGNERKLLEAGSDGFANIAIKLADDFQMSGLTEQAEVMRLLSGLAKDFSKYVEGSVIKLDSLVPPPLALWRTNPQIRQWISNLYGVGSQIAAGKRTLRMWKDEFGRKIDDSPLAKLDINPEASKVLNDVAKEGALLKSQMNDVANYGGRMAGHYISPANGAVTKTNFNMIDYTDFTVLDQFMKDLIPFWMYPAKSVPFWIKTLVQHPEIVAFYYKYQRWSKTSALQAHATTSRGEVLPSLKGYVPILPGLWFNPLAPLLFRYAFPRVDNIPEEDPELSPLQSVAKFFLDDAPIFGINISPVMSAVLQTFYDPYYPKTNLAYDVAKAVIPIEFIPPFAERWIMAQTRKVASGWKNIPERFSEEVSWKDYLIEREILINALDRMKDITSQVEKEAIAKEAYAIITRDESLGVVREEDPLWLEARAHVENSEYYRRIAGMFTGIYAKEFTSGQAELSSIRDEVNLLRDMINDEILVTLFKPYMSQADVYKLYTTRKYETPEGWITNSYNMTRYVTDEEGNVLTGALRRQAIAEDAIVQNQTELRYEAIKAAADLKDERLHNIPVGAQDLYDQIMTDYYTAIAQIDDPNGLYPLAKKDYVMGYKPISLIEEHMTGEWWRTIKSTYPRYVKNETWTQYELRVAAWKDGLAKQAELLSPIFQLNFNWNVFEGEIDTEERLSKVDNIMKKLVDQTNAEGYEQWQLKNDSVIDAIWNAYETLYLQPYFDAVKDLSGNERSLAEIQFFKTHTFEPGEREIQQWIVQTYGAGKFGEKLIRDTINGLTFATPEQIEQLKDEPKDPNRNIVYDILAWAGPKQSENYRALMLTYIGLGGYESDFDVWYGLGGNINNYPDVEKYYDFLDLIQEAAAKVGAKAPDEQQLKDMLLAEADQAEFKADVMAELGLNFYTTLAVYMYMGSDERKEWRNKNKDLYKKINTYFNMRDDYAKTHPLWAAYYYPSFDASTGTTSAGLSSAAGSGYQASSFEKEEARWWLPFGKRSSLDAMALFTPGKLGSAGVTRQPWWPQSLLDLLDPLAVGQVNQATTGQAPLPNATVTYLKRVATNHPEYARAIRNNLKIAKRVYPQREVAKDIREMQ